MKNYENLISAEETDKIYPFEVIPYDHPEDMEKPWIRDSHFVPIVLVYSLCLLFGSTGNALVMWAMCGKRSQTVTGMFLVSLAVADLLLLLSAPADVASYFVRSLMGGNVTCKMVGYGRMLSAFSTVLNLMAITVERFIVIVYPMRSRQFCTIRNCKLTLVLVWTLAILMALPSIFTWEVQPFFYGKFDNASQIIEESVVNVLFCEEASLEDGQIMSIYHLVMLFLLPLAVHSVCYSTMIYVLWSSTTDMYLTTHVGNTNGNGHVVLPNSIRNLPQSQSLILDDPLALSANKHDNKSDRSSLLQVPNFGRTARNSTAKNVETSGINPAKQHFSRNRTESLAYTECPAARPTSRNRNALRIILNWKKRNQACEKDNHHDSSMPDRDREPETINPTAKRQSVDLKAGRRQVIKMLLAITLAFMVCWGPFVIFEVVRLHSLMYYGTMTYLAKIIVKLLPYTHCCLNPIIYGFMSKNFRKSLRKACACSTTKSFTADLPPIKHSNVFSSALSGIQMSPKLDRRRQSLVQL